VKPFSFLLLALFALVVLATAFGTDLGCADGCEDGGPCTTACAACSCAPVVPATAVLAHLGSASTTAFASPAADESPRFAAPRGVLHVPRFA